MSIEVSTVDRGLPLQKVDGDDGATYHVYNALILTRVEYLMEIVNSITSCSEDAEDSDFPSVSEFISFTFRKDERPRQGLSGERESQVINRQVLGGGSHIINPDESTLDVNLGDSRVVYQLLFVLV